MFFSSDKEINRLSKKTNRLFSKGMSNIYLKVTIDTFSKLPFSGFKKFVTRSVFVELHFTQLWLNFKTSCYNLKIRDLGAKLCVAFLYLLIFKGIMMFLKPKSPCILLNKNTNFNKNETEWKTKNPLHSFKKTNLAL